MDARSRQRGDFGTEPDAHRFDRRDRHQRLGQASVELAIPVDVAPETGGDAPGDHFEASTDGVTGLPRPIDLADHPPLDIRDRTAERRVGRQIQNVLEADADRVVNGNRPDTGHVTHDLGFHAVQ